MPEIENLNPTKTETAGAGLTTLASHVDPFPHILVAGLTAVGSAYAYYSLRQPQTALLAGAISGAFVYSGYLLCSGEHRASYLTGTLASAALLGATLPRAYKTPEAYPVMMAALGGISTLENAVKYAQVRTGRPRDQRIHTTPGSGTTAR
ncbi:hypothetical protein BJ742DRAFT_775468 [Cladochytrium replicatum]|nr:hypothetical protein BJ742DRAFT_775468 [Cladochytrium replicatum]